MSRRKINPTRIGDRIASLFIQITIITVALTIGYAFGSIEPISTQPYTEG